MLITYQLARFSGVFYRLRNYVNKETLCMLYYSLVYSRIQYGIIVWGTADKTRIECLRVRLNRILRIILSCGIETPTTKLYSALQFLKTDEIYEFELYKFMYQLHHGKLPEVFYNSFTNINSIHVHDTRFKDSATYFLPRVKGGKSSSQFQWFTRAKIELYFLIFFVLILGLRLQRYSTNTKRCPPEKSFWKL